MTVVLMILAAAVIMLVTDLLRIDLIALSTSNSFVLPTHQVNALLKSFGRYRNRDYLKAGSAMTIVFHLIVVAMISLFYLK